MVLSNLRLNQISLQGALGSRRLTVWITLVVSLLGYGINCQGELHIPFSLAFFCFFFRFTPEWGARKRFFCEQKWAKNMFPREKPLRTKRPGLCKPRTWLKQQLICLDVIQKSVNWIIIAPENGIIIALNLFYQRAGQPWLVGVFFAVCSTALTRVVLQQAHTL